MILDHPSESTILLGFVVPEDRVQEDDDIRLILYLHVLLLDELQRQVLNHDILHETQHSKDHHGSTQDNHEPTHREEAQLDPIEEIDELLYDRIQYHTAQ